MWFQILLKLFFRYRALKLMELSDSRLAAGVAGNLKLEVAFIYMLDQFRKIYVSDQIQKANKVYEQLEKNLGLQDETAVLTVYVRKMLVFPLGYHNPHNVRSHTCALNKGSHNQNLK